MIPHTLVLRPGLIVHSIYNGYWFWGRPSVDDLRHDLRDATARSAPTGTSARPGCATPGTRATTRPSTAGTGAAPGPRGRRLEERCRCISSRASACGTSRRPGRGTSSSSASRRSSPTTRRRCGRSPTSGRSTWWSTPRAQAGSVVTIFTEDLDAQVAAIAARGLEPDEREIVRQRGAQGALPRPRRQRGGVRRRAGLRWARSPPSLPASRSPISTPASTGTRASSGGPRTVRVGEEMLWEIDEHATLFIEPNAAQAGTGRITLRRHRARRDPGAPRGAGHRARAGRDLLQRRPPREGTRPGRERDRARRAARRGGLGCRRRHDHDGFTDADPP